VGKIMVRDDVVIDGNLCDELLQEDLVVEVLFKIGIFLKNQGSK
jgi:hypothetical protein